MGNTAETVLGLWTSSMYTPTKLTNRIYKKWSNFRVMGIRPLNVTKNRKVLWPVTWQFDYKKADFWSSNQFAFLWIKNSFSGLPCLEFVILRSKTGPAWYWIGKVNSMKFVTYKPPQRSLSLHSSRDQNRISSRRYLLSSNYKRLVREKCCPSTAQIWLVQIGRPLPDWYSQKTDVLLSLAVFFLETRGR